LQTSPVTDTWSVNVTVMGGSLAVWPGGGWIVTEDTASNVDSDPHGVLPVPTVGSRLSKTVRLPSHPFVVGQGGTSTVTKEPGGPTWTGPDVQPVPLGQKTDTLPPQGGGGLTTLTVGWDAPGASEKSGEEKRVVPWNARVRQVRIPGVAGALAEKVTDTDSPGAKALAEDVALRRSPSPSPSLSRRTFHAFPPLAATGAVNEPTWEKRGRSSFSRIADPRLRLLLDAFVMMAVNRLVDPVAAQVGEIVGTNWRTDSVVALATPPSRLPRPKSVATRAMPDLREAPIDAMVIEI